MKNISIKVLVSSILISVCSSDVYSFRNIDTSKTFNKNDETLSGQLPVSTKAISFGTFSDVFLFTFSTDEYYRNIIKLKSDYGIQIPKKHIDSIYQKVGSSNKQKINNLLKNLSREAWLRVENQENQFYTTLEKLTKEAKIIENACLLEILLVKLQRETAISMQPESNNTVPRYVHLIQHARYEVFSTFLFEISKTH